MSERGKSGIYSITNTVSGKRYVGQAASIGDRWLTHKSHLNMNRHHCKHLQAAWRKYGADSFVFVVLEYVPLNKELLATREQHWMDALQPEYNMAPAAGSSFGIKHPPRSLAFRERMSEMKRGFKHKPETIELLRRLAAEQNYSPSPEHREKLRATHTGKPKRPESIEKQRQQMIGRKQHPDLVARRAVANTGKKRTPEQCARISAAKRASAQRENA
jgi:group I intron endonuclease